MPNESSVLTRQFVDEVITMRSYACQIADLAATMAREAGEPLHRPLSREQIQRAIEVNGAEANLVLDALLTHLETMQQSGKLPEQASLPRR